MSNSAQATLLWSSIVGILNGLCKDGDLVAEIQSISNAVNAAIAPAPAELSEETDGSAFALEQWLAYTGHVSPQHCLRQHLDLALAIAFLRDSGRQQVQASPAEIESIWSLVRGVLAETPIISKFHRSAQGFLVVPLWCVAKDNNIQESVQLHVWLPDGKRGGDEAAVIHSHQQFTQSWVLFGQSLNYQYEVQQAESTTATHAKYELSWSDDGSKGADKACQATQTQSARYVNTGELVRTVETQHETQSPHMTYNQDAGAFHRSKVSPDEMHVAFVFFDSQRGFQHNAPFLGPVDGDYYQERVPEDMAPSMLAEAIETFRTWERFYQQGLAHTRSNELEEALLAHSSALAICDGNPQLPQATRCRYVALAELGYVYRMLGRFVKASECLDEAIHKMPRSQSRLKALGELAVVYRHLDRLDDSKRACEEQYETAKHMGSEPEMERAIGNLGMVNYQLFLLNHDPTYLATAIKQLKERVERCRRLKDPAAGHGAAIVQSATAREAIAFYRLSLCYSAEGYIDKAINAASECQHLSFQSGDPSKVAFSRWTYGRALLLNGQKEDALAQFNPSDGNTPVLALSKEPCEEHRGYIREMIDAGADLTSRDRLGYSALDYAVYGGDKATQKLLIEGLQRRLSHEEVEQYRLESTLRKAYREVFQEKLRPVLLQSNKQSCIKQLRQVYAKTLASDKEKASRFDTFKYVRLADFVQHGRLPKSNDNLTCCIEDDADEDVFVIFISYTWTKKKPGDILSPDDAQNTKYHQMISALDSFLEMYPDIDPKTICVWLVSTSTRPPVQYLFPARLIR